MNATGNYYYLIEGQPTVKKNTQRAAIGKTKAGKAYPKIYYSKQYVKWHRAAKAVLLEQPIPHKPIDQPIILECHFFIQHHMVVDLSALYEGIQDLLVECGVLADDNYTIVTNHGASKVSVDPQRPRMEIAVINAHHNPLPRPEYEDDGPF